jgi:cleavage and polyadenylation specificity factor subunit 3
MTKRGAEIPLDDGDVLEIMPIGAGNEVGRSCVLVTFKGKKIMFDCGIHPAYPGIAGLPFFDAIDDPSEIDLLLVSHFHLDHAAALPYFLEKTTFKGKVFMTHPTKAIYKMLLTDYVKVSNIAVDDILYDENDLNESMEKIDQINYHQQREVNGIKFWCYNAGHVLGAAMFMVEIAGVRLLYTGDFSRQEDRHLMAAETPSIKPDILVVESTYGVQIHEPRKEREARFTGLVHDIVRRGGRCLIPVFALGRAQELLLILDEYWEAHRDLRNVPIYYASTLAKKCMKVYQTYINMMNEKIRKQFAIENPFIFKHISNLKGMDQFDDAGPSVVMASPGMLQSGLSRELFEMWCADKVRRITRSQTSLFDTSAFSSSILDLKPYIIPSTLPQRNGVILPGYCVEGTLAKTIMSEPPEITASSGASIPLRLSVHYISFSAHSDFKQTSEFIDLLQPPYVVLVHGDSNEMNRLKQGKKGRKIQNKKCLFLLLLFLVPLLVPLLVLLLVLLILLFFFT